MPLALAAKSGALFRAPGYRDQDEDHEGVIFGRRGEPRVEGGPRLTLRGRDAARPASKRTGTRLLIWAMDIPFGLAPDIPTEGSCWRRPGVRSSDRMQVAQ